MKKVILVFLFLSFHSWFGSAAEETDGSGDHVIPKGIWTPGSTILPEDHHGTEAIDDERYIPTSPWQGLYTNCIASKQRDGIALGQAIKECEKYKEENGDVGDYLGNIPESKGKKEESESGPNKPITARVLDLEGNYHFVEISEEDMQRVLTDLQIKKLGIQESEDQVALVRRKLTGAEVLEVAEKSEWTKLLQANQIASLLSSALNRQQQTKPRQSRFKIEDVGKVFSFAARRVPVVAVVVSSMAHAGDGSVCGRYDSYQGVSEFLSYGRQKQMQEVKQCPGLATQAIQLNHKY